MVIEIYGIDSMYA